jgi:hypothetical protein
MTESGTVLKKFGAAVFTLEHEGTVDSKHL